MAAYRSAEPAFCRGCGRAWSPGEDACISCGESLLRDMGACDDSAAAAALKRSLLATGLVVAATWAATWNLVQSDVTLKWSIALAAALCCLAMMSIRAWAPGAWTRAIKFGASRRAYAAALMLGLVLPLGFAFAQGKDALFVLFLTADAEFLHTGQPLIVCFALILAAIGEELLLRGVVFEATESLSGKKSAIATTTILSALMSFGPAYIVMALVGGILRATTNSVGPAIVFRVVAGVAWLLWFQSFVS